MMLSAVCNVCYVCVCCGRMMGERETVVALFFFFPLAIAIV